MKSKRTSLQISVQEVFVNHISLLVRLLRLLESTRDFETDEEVNAIDDLKTACASNLALACYHLEEYAQVTKKFYISVMNLEVSGLSVCLREHHLIIIMLRNSSNRQGQR